MNVDGTNKQAVLTGATNDTSPFFSLDGQWLVFNRVVGDPEDQQLQLCRVPAAGGQVVGLTNPADFDELPAFSPDGAHIIYKHGGPPDICRIPSDHLPGDNSTMENLTNTPTQSEDSPQYSYEGDKIAFMRGTTGLPRAPRSGS
jgi:Tol biopolymer transport system component